MESDAGIPLTESAAKEELYNDSEVADGAVKAMVEEKHDGHDGHDERHARCKDFASEAMPVSMGREGDDDDHDGMGMAARLLSDDEYEEDIDAHDDSHGERNGLQMRRVLKKAMLGIAVIVVLIVAMTAEAEAASKAESSVTPVFMVWYICVWQLLSFNVLMGIVLWKYWFLPSDLKEPVHHAWADSAEQHEAIELRPIDVLHSVPFQNESVDAPSAVSTLVALIRGEMQEASRELSHEISARVLMKYNAVLAPALLGALYLYMTALQLTAPGKAVTIMNSLAVFVYLLSLCFLGTKFAAMKLVYTVICLSGVALVGIGGEAQEEDAQSWMGDAAALASALLFASFFVGSRKWFGEANMSLVSLNIFIVGVYGSIALFPIVCAQWVLGYISFDMDVLLYSSITTFAGFVVNYTDVAHAAFGIAATSPLFVAVGGMLSIPSTALFDVITDAHRLSVVNVIGIALVCIGFIGVSV